MLQLPVGLVVIVLVLRASLRRVQVAACRADAGEVCSTQASRPRAFT